MLKHQILITVAIIALAIWIGFKIRDRKQSDNDDNPLNE
jgi:predicted negative regulator of RcsB-dependent stress response